MFRLVKRSILFVGRTISKTACPECGAYYGHSPGCNLTSREEILRAYMWTQGQLNVHREEANQVQRRLYTKIDDLTNENKMRRKEVQDLNAKIRKMSNG